MEELENLSFESALKKLMEKGAGWRIHRQATPGILLWIDPSKYLVSNLPYSVESYLMSDWNVIQDDTEIRQ